MFVNRIGKFNFVGTQLADWDFMQLLSRNISRIKVHACIIFFSRFGTTTYKQTVRLVDVFLRDLVAWFL